jgi:hypothetical protein
MYPRGEEHFLIFYSGDGENKCEVWVFKFEVYPNFSIYTSWLSLFFIWLIGDKTLRPPELLTSKQNLLSLLFNYQIDWHSIYNLDILYIKY